MIRRREFIAGLGGAAAWPVGSSSVHCARRPRHSPMMPIGGFPSDVLGARWTHPGRWAMEVSNEQALDSKRVDHCRGHC
jgi:hypothetical protein